MEEIDIKTYPKKINKDLDNMKTNIVNLKN